MTISYFCAAVVNVVIDAILIPDYGVVGAAVGTIAAYLVSMAIQYGIMLKKVDVKRDIVKSLGYLLKAIPMLVIVSVIGRNSAATWTTTLIQIIIGAIAYFVVLILIRDPMLSYLLEKARTLKK